MNKLKMPSPKSPAQLDDKILAYATKNAPEKNRHYLPGWATAMVTVSIVAVAVMIVLPQKPQQQLPATEAAYSGKSRAEQAPSGELAETRMLAKPAAKPKVAPAPTSIAESSAFLADKEMAYEELADIVAVESFDKSTLPIQLENIFELLGAGKTKEAEAAYKTLRERCPDCELPPDLEQAVEKFNTRH